MKQQQSISIVAPGFAGVNTQDSPSNLSPNFALAADNCVIDSYGRVGSRQGWVSQTTSGSTQLSGTYVQFLHEHVNADGSLVVFSGGNNKLLTGGIGGTFTDITPAAYTVTANYWKAATANGIAMIVQQGHEPIVYNSTLSPAAKKITTYTGLSQSFGTNYPRDVLAAFGRFWCHDGKTIYWSTDIADATFPTFTAGSSGTLNIASVLPDNTDTIVAIESHNNFLIIFCKNNIVIYNNADNVLSTSFAVADTITGVGCIARDSVQKTGNDLIFLSNTGVRSLGRLIQEKSMPMRDLTKNIRDDLQQDIEYAIAADSTMNSVKSVYSEKHAFYIITFPAYMRSYVVDMRQQLEDGSARVTLWQNLKFNALTRRRNRDILIGFKDTIGKYSGYTDNGVAYTMKYNSSYLDLQSPSTLKIVKKVKATIIGGASQTFVVKLGYDYVSGSYSFSGTIAAHGVAEYNIGEYNIAEYSNGVSVDTVTLNTLGSGNTVQIGFECNINGNPMSIQKIDMFVVTGKSS